jgi:hypothetical protein
VEFPRISPTSVASKPAQMVTRIDRYTDLSRRVSQRVPGDDEVIVLIRGTRIKNRMSTPNMANTIVRESGFLQERVLNMFLPSLQQWKLCLRHHPKEMADMDLYYYYLGGGFQQRLQLWGHSR